MPLCTFHGMGFHCNILILISISHEEDPKLELRMQGVYVNGDCRYQGKSEDDTKFTLGNQHSCSLSTYGSV